MAVECVAWVGGSRVGAIANPTLTMVCNKVRRIARPATGMAAACCPLLLAHAGGFVHATRSSSVVYVSPRSLASRVPETRVSG